jgi:Carboxypeptidase regulatory-like domain
MKNRIACAACLIVVAFQIAPVAQPQVDGCDSKTYENHNQVDPKPLKLPRIQGTGVIEIRDNQIKPGETVPGACLALFTADQKFVASTKADSRGVFHFDEIAPGQYRLMARAPGFCTANIPIQVIQASRKSKLQQQQIVIHYRIAAIDTCSWGAVEKNGVHN